MRDLLLTDVARIKKIRVSWRTVFQVSLREPMCGILLTYQSAIIGTTYFDVLTFYYMLSS